MNFSFRAHAQCVLATAMAFFTLGFSLDSFAAGVVPEKAPIHHREIFISQPFSEVVIHGNVHIVLTMDKTKTILVEGSEQLADAVQVETVKGKLVIRAKGNAPATTTLYLPAASLTRLHFDGDGTLYSDGVIEHPALSVMLNGTIDVRIASASILRLHTTDAYELED